ncbi:PQQ-dependent sugar dehydrogenase [Kibdelosporangium aridum]|uniref:PQQ-dependent sugar dehydrogenase n=1 Tax=Kibdelosporangium aridum TaxID=2030 RepID=UPI000524A034
MKKSQITALLLAVFLVVVPQGASAVPIAATEVATSLRVPWAVVFLPDKSALVTERDTGRILSIKGGTVREVAKISGVQVNGEGGLLGIAVSPKYATDRYIYVYYTTELDNRIVRLRLGESPKVIVKGIPVAGAQIGGRLAFGPDGFLYAGTGDAANSDSAQDPKSLGGKILRMTPDGKPAPGNPFRSLVYSMGHRNVQGLAWDAKGRMYASELGQQDLDEVNLIQAGKNYGWPECEGPCTNKKYVNPLVTWPVDQASPSGIAIYKGNLYVTALRGERLWKSKIKADGTLAKPEAILKGTYGRLREAVVAPDGKLWIATTNRDGNGGTPRPTDDRIISTDG